MKNKHYNKNLKMFARENRKDATKAENFIWQSLLRRKQFYGIKFLRQRPVLNFISDFMCKEINLIIEIDGLTHTFDDTAKNDLKRDKELKLNGFNLIRFQDEEVLNDLDNVIRTLEKYLAEKGLINI